ncbi:DsbA family protein [Solwaraspora sp. WMMD1047]|uniref:2-hydroxychromene-2-carboxylate isomerase n=1 Tax=Solwaraspora sp. WMMD1047 TaxID=3016102 RepID=UPI002416F2D8|nr:DsbA family protein [Solwaraspora sp. WMMD1047]MDG4831712.1 DsbA family protein [Solwaraspora sp. WMMD1047]
MSDARFYFSLRSPYSWLAYQDLMTHYPDVVRRVEWRPFWEPDEESQRLLAEADGSFPYVDMSRAKARYILADVRRLARARGLTIVWPVDRKPCWEVCHLAYLEAHRHGAGQRFIASAYAARWERGRDITDPAVVADIAADLGLDPVALSTAVDDPRVRQEGLRALQAIDNDGVFGVPFFIKGRQKYWGVDRLPDFVAEVRGEPPGQAHQTGRATTPDRPPAPLDGAGLGPAADQGHAGGCG